MVVSQILADLILPDLFFVSHYDLLIAPLPLGFLGRMKQEKEKAEIAWTQVIPSI
jgi:hypothetical protein